MALVNAPDKVHFFRKWAEDNIRAATINFGSRVKSTATKSLTAKSRTKRKRRRKRRSSRTRRLKNG